jgi:predicted chitinase
MSKKPIVVGDEISPAPTDLQQRINTVFLAQTGVAAENYELNFLNESISYFDRELQQSFEYVLVDNIGTGSIRIAFNRLGMTLTNSINGAKTLRAGDSLYIQDSIQNLSIYFIENSIVELVLISK